MYVHPNKRWTQERRERVGALHRKRHGAPDGFSTVHGIHVPTDHAEPVRFWADWVKRNHGAEAALTFIEGLKGEDWASMPSLRAKWLERKQINQNRELIRRLEWEAHRADQNRG